MLCKYFFSYLFCFFIENAESQIQQPQKKIYTYLIIKDTTNERKDYF